jgi:hypothetical protein
LGSPPRGDSGAPPSGLKPESASIIETSGARRSDALQSGSKGTAWCICARYDADVGGEYRLRITCVGPDRLGVVTARAAGFPDHVGTGRTRREAAANLIHSLGPELPGSIGDALTNMAADATHRDPGLPRGELIRRDSDGGVRWRTRIATGESSFGPGLALVDKLTGVLVRCPKTGLQACVPYRVPRLYAADVRYHLKCRACHDKHYVGKAHLAALLREVLQATSMQHLP